MKIEIIWKNNTVKSFIFSLFEIFPSDFRRKKLYYYTFLFKAYSHGLIINFGTFFKTIEIVNFSYYFFYYQNAKIQYIHFFIKDDAY